ncbi:MAG: helix-turn-helix domain-containing protein [Lentisphaeria bacterium]|nr:helix-turn-helix domain-containing protein [Lentisphaeria bacterium]
MIRLDEKNMKLLLEAVFADSSIDVFLNICEKVVCSPLSFSSWTDGRIWRSKNNKQPMNHEGDDHARYVMDRLTHLENRQVTRTQGGPGIPKGNYLCWAFHGMKRYGLVVVQREDGIELEDELVIFIGQCLGQICAGQNVARMMTPDELLDGLMKNRIQSEAQLYAMPGIEKMISSLDERRMIVFPFSQRDIQRTGSFISMHIHNNYEDAWCAWEDRGFLAMIRDEKGNRRFQEKKLKTLAEALSCPVCLGPRVESFIEIPRFFSKAMSIPSLRNAQPGEIIRTELYPEAALIYESGLSVRELQKLTFPLIDEMERYDAENRTEYMDTVRIYINSRFNATVTAQKLFIHTNTVFYRLDRIRELWDVDILDADVLYNIMLAFRIREYQ